LTKIFLIRHAEAEGNIFRRAHGHVNGQIIGRGFKQIELLGERFAAEKIDAVYSSDLTRAFETASAISKPRDLPVNTMTELREVMMGEWEDNAWGDLEYYIPEMVGLFSNDPALWRVKDGEDYGSVVSRMTGCLEKIGRCHEGGTVAVVSHGFAIRSLTCSILGIPSSETSSVPYCDNTAVALLLYNAGNLSVEFQRDNSHLQSDTSTFANQTWWRKKGELKPENLRYMPVDPRRDKELLGSIDNDILSDACTYKGYKEYTAILNDEPVGIVGLSENVEKKVESGSGGLDTAFEENESSTGWICYLYVKPMHRGKNYGVQLLGQAISELRKLKREFLRICVPAGSFAIEFCKRYEFTVIGESGPDCLMEKNIKIW